MSLLNLHCPFPENINPLSPNGFMFMIEHLPEMKYFCQQVALPSISLPAAPQATPFVSIPRKGEQAQFDNLTVQFLVDSKMENFKAIKDWMIDGMINGGSKDEKIYSDGILSVLDSSNQIVQEIRFVDMLPVSLDGITFASTNSDVQYVVGTVTFAYTYYYFS